MIADLDFTSFVAGYVLAVAVQVLVPLAVMGLAGLRPRKNYPRRVSRRWWKRRTTHVSL